MSVDCVGRRTYSNGNLSTRVPLYSTRIASLKLVVHEGTPLHNRPIACLGPGTGLGQVFGVRTASDGLSICPSEGGESDFVARSSTEWALREHIAATLATSHVKVEHVAAASGIYRIWDFLQENSMGEPAKKQKLGPPSDGIAAAIRASADPSAVVAAHGTRGAAGEDAMCVRAVDLFINALGVEAANLALRFQAHGGVYIAGGVTAKLAARLTGDTRLREAYLSKGKSVAAYEGCPLYVVNVEGDELGMDGAWAFVQVEARAWTNPEAGGLSRS